MKKKLLFLIALAALVSIVSVACGMSGNSEANSAVIVIGEEENQDLAETLQAAMGKSVKIVNDTEETDVATEILIGKTNREQSIADSQGVREGDGWVKFHDGCIVIQGDTTEKLESAVNYFVENYVPAWKDGEEFPVEYSKSYCEFGSYALQTLTFDGIEIYEYSIVTKDGAETEDAVMIQQHIEAMSTYKLPIISSTDLKEGQKAIVFGSSEARNAAEKCQQLGEKEFLIEAEEDTLYLCAWDAAEEYILSHMFLGETVGCQLNTDTANTAVVNYEDYSLKFTTVFDGSGKFNAMCTQVMSIPYPMQDVYTVLQGGCTDGKVLYLVVQEKTEEKGNCIILKVDPSTWEVLQTSKALPVDHGNGITYLPEKNQLLIAHCNPDPELVSWVDADTLEYIKTENIGYTAATLSWSQERGSFVAMGSSSIMHIIDKNLKITESYYGLVSNATKQGYAADGDYVYVVANGTNYIHVLDWEGHWIEEISIPISAEMEMLIPCGDKDIYYTTIHKKDVGAELYATVFYKVLYE
ncbi:MAG: hypothetical protein IJZ53_07265 [Tyzzerella sp.]|nr:hypothetical protein [Tyzzerella sp.]